MPMPDSKATTRENVKRMLWDIPATTAGYALGYGIARTALEHALGNAAQGGITGGAVRHYVAPVAGIASGYAALRAAEEMRRRWEAPKK